MNFLTNFERGLATKPIVIGGRNGDHIAVELSQARGYELGSVEVKKFPDGETYIRIHADVQGRDVIYVNSLQREPNESIIETLYTLDTLRDLGARRVVAVIPYMSYARQDSRFNPGEAISIHVLAKLFKSISVDHIVTVDMHLHRIADPSSLFGANFHNITGVRELARYLKKNYSFSKTSTVVIGPDEEAEQWAKVMAEELGGLEYGVLEKTRLSPEKVVIEARGVKVEGMDVVIVDDIISTGGTIVEAVKTLRSMGARDFYIAAVHAILVGDALSKLLRLNPRDLVATNTVLSPISRVSIAPAIAEALDKIL
ncbi:ribose-phosphate diphosphokinase [Thermogladius sp. 4427co]|uniref:ribose-phosphate diphosphokinase n=1 Tax=Thermogladius sp. 4427co TaxID=3450718 RepID=UPI003F7924AD